MNGKSQNQEIRLLADFTDRAISFVHTSKTNEPKRSSRSFNEAIRLIATFSEIAQPIAKQQTIPTESSGNGDTSSAT